MFWCSKNRLLETVLLGTLNICFEEEIRIIVFSYALLSGGLRDMPQTQKCDIQKD